MPHQPARLTFLKAFLFCCLLTLIATGCGTSDEVSNRAPTVVLTSGPVENETVHYRIVLSWIGQDTDGTIARYEIAIDPPGAFTEEEIASGGPGITAEFVAGDATTPDRTRVSPRSWMETPYPSTGSAPRTRCGSSCSRRTSPNR